MDRFESVAIDSVAIDSIEYVFKCRWKLSATSSEDVDFINISLEASHIFASLFYRPSHFRRMTFAFAAKSQSFYQKNYIHKMDKAGVTQSDWLT